MKRLLVFATLSTLLFACGGTELIEKTEYYYNENGHPAEKMAEYTVITSMDEEGFEIELRHGLYKAYYQSGEIREKANFEYGNIVGTATTYHSNGQVAEVSNWEDGQYHGIIQYYFENGRIQEEYVYTQGRLNGTQKNYYENGKLKKEAFYKDDLLWNIIANYDSTGKKLDSLTLVNGEGVMNDYYANGQLAGKVHMAAGDFHGPFMTFYENGQPQVVTHYKKGKKHGDYKSFYEDGTLMREATFYQDINSGPNKLYNEAGLLVWLTPFKAPPFDRSDSLLLGLGSYDHGDGISGIVDPMGTLKGIRQGMERTYHNNGKLKSEALYINDEVDSIYMQYDINGKLIVPKQAKNTTQSGKVDTAQQAGDKNLEKLMAK